jgi:hypothetical protein
MAILLDKEGTQALAKLIGKRMRAARMAANIGEEEAGKIIGHKGATQICLCESGERILPVLSLVKLADKYGVSMDYALGRIDDPLADPFETNQGAIARTVANGVESCFRQFSASVATYTVASLEERRKDMHDIRRITERAQEVKDALERFASLNPEFEEDMRGGARLVASIGSLNALTTEAATRIEAEKKARKIRQFEASIEVEHFCLTPR